MIDPDGPEPLYQQLARVLRERIASGELQPRRPIPSTRQLVQEFGLARGTVVKAVDLLREAGLVETVPGRGTFVVER